MGTPRRDDAKSHRWSAALTISTTSSAVTVGGNGSTTSFAFGFIAGVASNLLVTYTNALGVTTTLSSSQYTVTLNPAAAGQYWGIGGTITYPTAGSPIASGTSLTIQRILPLSQLTSISNQGDFYPSAVEKAMDTLCMEIQQVAARTTSYRGTWATGIGYNYGDIVQDGVNGANTSNIYMCIVANTSGTWSTDLANGYWVVVINVASILASIYAAGTAMWKTVTFLTYANSPYTIANTTDGTLFVVDTSGGNVVVNMPAVSSVTLPFTVGVKKETVDSNTITIYPTGTDTIDGNATKVIQAASSGTALIAEQSTSPYKWICSDFGAIAGNMTVNTFTGNGATTAFTLTNAPGSASNAAVYISGVRQTPSIDYSVAGTTLTFVTAPANTASILCLIGSTLTITSPASGSVSPTTLSTGGPSWTSGGILSSAGGFPVFDKINIQTFSSSGTYTPTTGRV